MIMNFPNIWVANAMFSDSNSFIDPYPNEFTSKYLAIIYTD